MTKSTTEAFDLLKETRAGYISAARQIADELIALHGETHARQVRDVMFRRGLLTEGISDYWLGPVFNKKKYVWTGKWETPPVPENTSSNIHAWRPVKIWTLVAV